MVKEEKQERPSRQDNGDGGHRGIEDQKNITPMSLLDTVPEFEPVNESLLPQLQK